MSLPPPLPTRPAPYLEQATDRLQEAFPDTPRTTITALLIALGGHVEPASQALLYLVDPTALPDIAEPRTEPSQVDRDAELARRLAGKYAQTPRGARAPPVPPKKYTPAKDDGPIDRFFDEELPEIGRQFSEGLEETGKAFAGFFGQLTGKKQNAPPLVGALGSSARNLLDENRDERPAVPAKEFQGIRLADNDRDLSPRWELLAPVAPEPSSDAFLVTDSEGEDEPEAGKEVTPTTAETKVAETKVAETKASEPKVSESKTTE